MELFVYRRKRGLLGSASGMALALFSVQAHAQEIELPRAPINQVVDERGVDLASGQLALSFSPLSIGDKKNGLTYSMYWSGKSGFRNNQMISAIDDSSSYAGVGAETGYHVSIVIGAISYGFTKSGSVYVPDEGDGTSLTHAQGSTSYIFVDRDGSVLTLSTMNLTGEIDYNGIVNAVATKYVRYDGMVTSFTYNYNCLTNYCQVRLQSVNNSSGYQLKFLYNETTTFPNVDPFSTIITVTAINNSVEYCDPASEKCTNLTKNWPYVIQGPGIYLDSSGNTSSAYTNFVIKDPVGRATMLTVDSSSRIVAVQSGSNYSNYGSSAVPNFTANLFIYNAIYSYNGVGNLISSVNLPGVGTWNYSYTNGSTVGTSVETVTPPAMGGLNPPGVSSKTYVIDNVRVAPLTVTDENGHVTTYTYDPASNSTGWLNHRINTVTLDGSGSNYTTYSYDDRGNMTSMVMTPASGSGLSALTTSATYPASPCANAATCNKPITTTDSAGQITNYYYNSNGMPDYVQSPAPVSGGVRPEVHYTYTTGQAQVVSSSGALAAQGDVITLPTGTRTCANGAYASCTNADLVISQLAYPTGATAHNLGVQSATTQSGDGSVASTTSMGYDSLGNAASVTDAVGNVSTATYAADRQILLAVGPSPDGSSTSARSAVQYHYNLDAMPDTVTTGSYNPATQVLTPITVTTTKFDAQRRALAQSVSDGTTQYALTQYSYNGVGLPDCVTVRMNPAVFSSYPSSACTLGTQGSDGPDRITEYTYDAAGQLSSTTSAIGVTGYTRRNFANSYTNHNLENLLQDGNGNETWFVYDGFDRPLRTCYQGTLATCQANTSTDYVASGYDSAGRLVSRSVRGAPASLISYHYDNLGRMTNVVYPGSGTYDQAVVEAYDNLGRLTNATDASGDSVAYTYDALGDVLSQGDATSVRTMAYDAAGRRTQLTWSDGRFVTYQYNGRSALSAILESGVTPLLSYGYDAVGRRTTLTRGNGVVTTYANYSPLGAGSMAIALPSASYNLTLAFAYNAAGQIKSRTATGSNQAWFYPDYYNVSRTYTANALNQYTASGSVVPAYDAKGNLSGAGGSAVYGYSTKNELVTRSDTGATFYHDPLGRLDTITASPTTTRLQYDGADIAAEVDGGSGTLLRRYVHGSSADEALVWYEGSDFSSRRYLIADERGSVIAVTDASGNPLAFNTYDEYGIPGSSNLGRFQYTGQAWIPELGVYSYKARMYSPTMGRFLQTDPAGYPDGLNWYAYAGNDPINGSDPTGMDSSPCDGSSSDCSAAIISSTNDLGGMNYRIEPSDGPDPDTVYAIAYPIGYSQNYSSQSLFSVTYSYDNYTPGLGPLLYGSPGAAPARSGAASPQSNQGRSFLDCTANYGGWKDLAALGLDVAATGVAMTQPEAVLLPMALSVASMTVTAISAQQSNPGPTYVGVGLGSAGFMQAGATPHMNTTGAASLLGRNWGAIGKGLIGLSAINDARSTYNDYSACMAGK